MTDLLRLLQRCANFAVDILDYVAAGVTIGVIAGFITWTAAIATAVWAVFRAMNEIHRWRNRNRIR